jgi:hypothetical protein
LPALARDAEIETNMQRLGVAAMGMFNRRSLHIRLSDLNTDLGFFGLERRSDVTTGATLSQGDLLVGSFFFVQESKSVHRTEGPGQAEADAAFEFLHNTFGEFLTAAFLLHQVLDEVDLLIRSRSDPRLREMTEKKWSDYGSAPSRWYASLMYAPLFTRPVIVDMMREWMPHVVRRAGRARSEFLEELDWIVSQQVGHLLTGSDVPSPIRSSSSYPFGSLPVIGLVALYSLNLVLMRTVLAPDGYVFDEDAISPFKDGARVWDRLTHLWRSWFALENLNGLSAVISAKRDGRRVEVRAQETFGIPDSSRRLDVVFNVGSALGDDILAGMAGLLALDAYRERGDGLARVAEAVDSGNLELQIEMLTKRLRAGDTSIPILGEAFERGGYVLTNGLVGRDVNWESLTMLLNELNRVLETMEAGEPTELLGSIQSASRTFALDLPSFVYHALNMERLGRRIAVPERVLVAAVRVAAKVGDRQELRWLLERLARRSTGNPEFARALLGELRRGGAPRQLRLAGPVGALDVRID